MAIDILSCPSTFFIKDNPNLILPLNAVPLNAVPLNAVVINDSNRDSYVDSEVYYCSPVGTQMYIIRDSTERKRKIYNFGLTLLATVITGIFLKKIMEVECQERVTHNNNCFTQLSHYLKGVNSLDKECYQCIAQNPSLFNLPTDHPILIMIKKLAESKTDYFTISVDKLTEAKNSINSFITQYKTYFPLPLPL